MRWIVGDVHGCAREFEALLERIRFDRARDELWCVGDLVNTGPDSLDVLRLWRDSGARATLGNHDVYALLARSGAWPRKSDTLDALFAAPDADALLALLRAQPVMVHLPPSTPEGRDVWVVHAGLRPQWSDLRATAAHLDQPVHDDAWLQGEEVAFATRVRCCTDAGEMNRYTGIPIGCPAGSRPWDDFYSGPALVVHGHWARRGHYRGHNTLGLDSGCVYGGALTAWCVEEDRVVQVDRITGR